jgi:hypothetical protein
MILETVCCAVGYFTEEECEKCYILRYATVPI